MLRPFDEARDLDDVVALQHRVSPPSRQWSPAEARLLLLDAGREHGGNVAVARADGELVGVVGWVDLGGGEFYGSPLVSTDQRGIIEGLIGHAVSLARDAGADWIRISGWPDERTKSDVLNAAGFLPVFDFASFERPVSADEPAPAPPARSRRVPAAEVDHARYADLYNRCFEHVDNAPPTTAAHAKEEWTADTVWPSASFAWTDDAGTYRAFSLCHDGGVIELIGVDAGWRRRGIGRAIMAHIVDAARADGIPALRSICATTNHASMRLHLTTGFRETARRTVWQLDL